MNIDNMFSFNLDSEDDLNSNTEITKEVEVPRVIRGRINWLEVESPWQNSFTSPEEAFQYMNNLKDFSKVYNNSKKVNGNTGHKYFNDGTARSHTCEEILVTNKKNEGLVNTQKS